MAQPTREEIIAYAREVAKRHGLSENEFLRVIEGESGFDPAAKGDIDPKTGQPQSGGLAQLFVGGGLGNVYQKQGGDPFNPDEWKQHLDFMGQQVAEGGQGYGPWHAAKRVGVGQFQGIPGQQPSQPGRRGRAGEVAQGAPMFPTIKGQAEPAKEPSLMELLQGIKPERQQTLLGLGTDALGWTTKDDPNRPSTLLGLGLQKAGLTGPEKKKAATEEKLAKVNAFAPQNEEEQLKKKLANKPVTLANMFMGQPAPAKPTTLGGWGLSKLFGGFG